MAQGCPSPSIGGELLLAKYSWMCFVKPTERVTDWRTKYSSGIRPADVLNESGTLPVPPRPHARPGYMNKYSVANTFGSSTTLGEKCKTKSAN